MSVVLEIVISFEMEEAPTDEQIDTIAEAIEVGNPPVLDELGYIGGDSSVRPLKLGVPAGHVRVKVPQFYELRYTQVSDVIDVQTVIAPVLARYRTEKDAVSLAAWVSTAKSGDIWYNDYGSAEYIRIPDKELILEQA